MVDSQLFDQLEFPPVIDTSEVDFVSEFYEPLLSRATKYKRGVGYFSSSWMRSAARGMAALAENGGTAKWITSPMIGEDDWEALQKGSEAKQDEVLREALEDEISNLRFDLEYNTRNTIAWMIADGILDIRFAVPKVDLSGDFHDKFGILRDEAGNKVAFHGSQNDSQHALSNYEAYSINCSWLGERDAEAVSHQERRFDKLWEGAVPDVEVYTIPDSVANDIAQLRDDDYRPYDDPTGGSKGGASLLRPYQRQAVDEWHANGGKGLFEMATGTGKTFTALAAAEEITNQDSGPSLVVIAVPFTHLAPQWESEMDAFQLEAPVYAYGTDNPDWKSDLSRTLQNLEIDILDQAVVLTTHTTLCHEFFIDQIQNFSENALLIGDEAHHLGSDHQQKGLVDEYEYRIGLSATPERYYDEEGTEFLLEYFGGTVFEYTLEDAIPEYLTPYEYHPVPVELTADEFSEYQKLSRKLARIAHNDQADDEVVERLAQKRANIIKSAENKYAQLSTVLDRLDPIDHLLVYTNSSQIDHVQDILNEQGIIQHKFTYREDSEERQRILSGFKEGEYDALVAMKCLDEGVDVEATKQAILMSNTGNPMEFIQRRGRVLRKSPGKEKSTIFDFIVVPTLDPSDTVADAERNILRKELKRFEEFAAHAKNEIQARNAIGEIRIQYRVSTDDGDEDPSV
ncbi:DEAD/DEAH box helicase family protein [Halobaculum rubrum]|uniref:DEAD/DEAH box helicase family protein n=1 Tax=Halobaculum rubrum TaxID=2872158 RepID=UPI001CA4452E|nr:DEAD/DEAH box helicase family protein [Halobaculum rubrum]QZY01206.1 DEAD/DEAH box helicase family protein [Halobaculum rubrum]